MAEKKENYGPDDGLAQPGPLSRGLSTMKVGFRPPDIPLMEKVAASIKDIKGSGGEVPSGSRLVIRSIDGFIQFRDLEKMDMDRSKTLRIIEFDPSRGTFLTSGEGKADVISEASWYILKTLRDQHVLFIFPDEKERTELPEERKMRTMKFLDLSSSVFQKQDVSAMGYRFLRFATLDEMSASPIFREIQSKSQ